MARTPRECDVIVVGAGVAGLSSAIFLRRSGLDVLVLDPLPSPGGASFGNAGLISAGSMTPMALPGMARQVPGWLRDPLGPLAVRPSYLPKAAPWLARWIKAGRKKRVVEVSHGLRALHRNAFEDWRDLLGSAAFADLIRRGGQVQIWSQAEETPTAAIERELRAIHGVESHVLSREELRQIYPGIGEEARRGLLMPGNGHTVSPPRLLRAMADIFRQEGGDIRPERAMKLWREGEIWTAMTNAANHRARHVVVAAGAWSNRLLEPLGLGLPLESERGYHAALARATLELRYPILHKSGGFGLTMLEDGLRVAGTVEIGGLDAAPDERRARVLIERARRLFPDLRHEGETLWMGHRPSMPDSLPALGPVERFPGLHLCFGHGHYGMTAGPSSGRLVARALRGDAQPSEYRAYSPSRFS